MTKEEKQLLLADICARLPYHLLGRDAFGKTREMKVIYPTGRIIAQEIDGENCSACGFIPYLRTMSSMTEEEMKYLTEHLYIADSTAPYEKEVEMFVKYSVNCIEYCCKHHFDYRGLIPMGLALEAPEGMYNTKYK